LLISLRTAKILYIGMGVLAVLLAGIYAYQAGDAIYLLVGLAFILILVCKFIFVGMEKTPRLPTLLPSSKNAQPFEMSAPVSLVLTAVIFVVFTVGIGYFSSLKYKTFSNATYDFGIFAQMFEQMKETGLPNTTIERSKLMSHFGVHFSPIFYLLLPGYLLFPTPLYLHYVQAFCVGLAVFPIWLICRELQFSPKTALFAVILYVIYPSTATGCFCDFHENKILSLVLLFLIYFVIKGKKIGSLIFALLTLMVKEDAAIYVAAVALWTMFYPVGKTPDEETCHEKKARIRFGAFLFAVAVLYFGIAVALVDYFGDGVMMSRLEAYLSTSDGGFIEIAKNCFYHIGYLIQKVFTQDKMKYVLWMLLPVAFLPLRNRRISIWILFLPMLVINLMPDWIYQYNVNYQYTYGVAALILAATLITLREEKEKKVQMLLTMCLAISLPMFASVTLPKINTYHTKWTGREMEWIEMEEIIASVPENASVTASGFFVPHFYFIDDLQSVPNYYGTLQETDYYAIDVREAYTDENKNPWNIVADGYELIAENRYIKLYKRK